MYFLAKANLVGGKFATWDTSTTAFYFKGWTGDPPSPTWDKNAWYAKRYPTMFSLVLDQTELTALGIDTWPLGTEEAVFLHRPTASAGS